MNDLTAQFLHWVPENTPPWLHSNRRAAFDALDLGWVQKVLHENGLSKRPDEKQDPAYAAVIESLALQLRSQGVLFGNLRDHLAESDERMQSLFGGIAHPYADAFYLLNTAFWQDGTLVRVPERTSCHLPLQAIRNGRTVVMDRQFVVVEAGGELEYVSGCLTDAMPSFSNLSLPVVEVFVGPGAKFTYIELENNQADHSHAGTTVIRLADNADLTICCAHLGRTMYLHAPVVEASASATIRTHIVEYADGSRKDAQGITIKGVTPQSETVYLIEKNAQINFPPVGPRGVMNRYDLNTNHVDLTPEVMDAMLEPFPMEVAAEIELFVGS